MKKSVIVLILFALTLTACFPFLGRGQATENAQAAFTQGAQTLRAQMTVEAGGTAIALLTRLAVQASATPPPPATNTPPAPATDTPPPTPTPSPTLPPPTATNPPLPCDWAEVVTDLTVPLDSPLPTGARFIKIWRVRNIGACAWTGGYALVHTGDDLMGAPATIPLPAVVQPGVAIDIQVIMTVPINPGTYQGAWLLRNESGGLFGAGPAAADPFFVRVQAYRPAALREVVYDFALNFCAATWQSAAGRLTCPGANFDANGAAVLLDRPALEGSPATGLALWTRPNSVTSGWINGQYPAHTLRANDHFLAQIGCLADSPNCDLTFQVSFQTQGGASRNLGSWREIFDGARTSIDIDLTPLADIAGWFVFSVTNNGDAGDANPVWVEPRIENLQPSSQKVLTWTRENGPLGCSQLEVFLTGPRSAVAVAYSCLAKTTELGRATLTEGELAQFLTWYQRLDEFDSEIYQAAGENPKVEWIYFKGAGSQNARNSDIDALNGFASSLLNRILGLAP